MTVGVDSGQTLYTVMRLRINVREKGKINRAQLWFIVWHATFYVSLCVVVSVYTIHNKYITQT